MHRGGRAPVSTLAVATVAVAIVLVGVAIAWSEEPSSTTRIGVVDFFGTSGVDVAAVRRRLPLRAGDTLEESRFEELQQKIQAAVEAVVHRSPTDVAGVCCDAHGGWLLYIGLAGSNHHPATHQPVPSGSACLPATAVDLYTRAVDANMKAAQKGDTAEDDSQGYALGNDPDLRQAQLALRDFAVKNAGPIRAALRDCSLAENRQAAAALLGYADRSAEQTAQLVQSANDADALVRNNALRALEVLAATPAGAGMQADALVGMLNSGSWTDRNKAGLLFMRLTERRDPHLRSVLAHQALASLVEMARWQDAPHALPYRLILGRIGGIEEKRLLELTSSGKVETIITAAVKK